MNQPNVEILLATYQGSDFLKSQLDSIYQQSYPHIRIIARDDASQDDSVIILKKYPLTLLESKENLGVKKNFSALLSSSQAPYITFSDQDDIWLPHKIEESLEVMRKTEKSLPPNTPVLVHTDLIVADHNLNEIHSSFWDYAGLNPRQHSSFNRLLVQNPVTGCAMMINRALADLAGDIPQEAKMHDWWLALTASAFGKIAAVDKASILYRQHSKNAIGAQKLGLTPMLKRFLKGDLEKARIGRKNQAESFLSRFEKKLSKSQKDALKAVIDADSNSWKKNAFNAYTHGIYRSKSLSNCVRFLMKNPF